MKLFRASAISLLTIVSLMLSGCVVIESSAISQRGETGQPISANASDYGVLRLSAPYGLTNQADTQLASQCANGELTNVQTELSMRDFFIVQLYNLSAAALCYVPPPPPPPPAPAPQTKIILRGVHFAFNKATIRSIDQPTLDEAAATLKANPKVTVHVDGYTDAIGSDRYNQKLSERRAQAVVNYLEGQGVPAAQLIPEGFGKSNPVASNKTADGRAQNRRVELVPVNQ